MIADFTFRLNSIISSEQTNYFLENKIIQHGHVAYRHSYAIVFTIECYNIEIWNKFIRSLPYYNVMRYQM